MRNGICPICDQYKEELTGISGLFNSICFDCKNEIERIEHVYRWC